MSCCPERHGLPRGGALAGRPRCLRRWLCHPMTPGAIPAYLRLIEQRMARLVLPPRRERSFPRAVKVKMSNYARKRPPTRKAVK